MSEAEAHTKAEVEEDEEVFLISALLDVLRQHHIEVKGIFAFETRCVFVFCHYYKSGQDVLLYIPSKYEIRTEKNIGIPVYSLMIEDEDEEHKEPPVESLFVSTTSASIQKLKFNKQKSLNRFIPIVSSNKYKIAYVDNYYVTFINRHNSIDGFLMSSPSGLKGYYLTIDLQNFYTLSSRLVDDLIAQQEMMFSAVFTKLETEIQKSKEYIKRAQTILDSINPKASLEQYNTRSKKLLPMLADSSKAQKAASLLNKIRGDNLKTMFEIENIAYILSELQE